MEFIKLTVEGKLEHIEADFPETEEEFCNSFNNFVHKQIGCEMYELAPTPSLWNGACMLVDESGKLTGKKVNIVAWWIANRLNPLDPIVGDVLFCGMHRVGELQELDFCGLNEEQIKYITRVVEG